MATFKNSSFKVKAGQAKTLTELNPEVGALVVVEGLLYYCDQYGFHRMNFPEPT